MENKDNILENKVLKQRCFKTPQGWPESMREKLMDIPAESLREKPESLFVRFRPYLNVAAMFAVAVCLWALYSLRTSKAESEETEFYIFLNSITPVTEELCYSDAAQTELTQEDLIDYFISSGTDIDYYLEMK